MSAGPRLLQRLWGEAASLPSPAPGTASLGLPLLPPPSKPAAQPPASVMTLPLSLFKPPFASLLERRYAGIGPPLDNPHYAPSLTPSAKAVLSCKVTFTGSRDSDLDILGAVDRPAQTASSEHRPECLQVRPGIRNGASGPGVDWGTWVPIWRGKQHSAPSNSWILV